VRQSFIVHDYKIAQTNICEDIFDVDADISSRTKRLIGLRKSTLFAVVTNSGHSRSDAFSIVAVNSA